MTIDAPRSGATVPDGGRCLPAALLHCWLTPERPWSAVLEDAEVQAFRETPGVHEVRAGLFSVAPSPGAPGIFDTAFRGARALLHGARGGARTLLHPAAHGTGGDSFAEALAARAPALRYNAVYVTGHAARRLEGRVRLLARGVYESPSGAQIPLVRLGGRLRWDDPRRNVQPLGRSVKAVPRRQTTAALVESWTAPILRVDGVLGCGKSRLVWETLRERGEPFVWTMCVGTTEASLAAQLFRELLERPRRDAVEPGAKRSVRPSLGRRALVGDPLFLTLRLVEASEEMRRRSGAPLRIVVDGFENASAADRELVELLCSMPQLGEAFRVLVIGRAGAPWGPTLASAPAVRVPLLGLAEAAALGDALTRGLSIPEDVVHRLVVATAGNPFALEEGLHDLVHRGVLRRVYGSFFFAGAANNEYAPSDRWICHVQAEAGRLGEEASLVALAAAETGLPPEPLRAALGAPREAAATWTVPLLDAGWVQPVDTAWGPGVEIACAPFAAALRATLLEPERAALRRSLGTQLLAGERRGQAGWLAYGLLRGTPEAIPALLGAAENVSEVDDVDDLLAALRAESVGAPAPARLELLWALLPLAHQRGRLEAYATELDDALALAAEQPTRLLALGALRAELQEAAGRFGDAEGSLRQALETAIAREADADRKALLSIRLGRVLLRDERYAEARRLFEEIQPLLERGHRPTLAASCDFYLGNIAFHEGRLDDARAHHEVALRLRREKNLRGPAATSLSALGSTALAQGFYAEAHAHFEAARRLLGETGDPSFELLGQGRALDRMGDFAGASPLLRQALALRLGKTDAAGEAAVRIALAENQLQLDHPDVARRELLQAHFQLSLRSPSRALADVESLLGRLALRQRQPEEARNHFRAALDLHRLRQDRSGATLDLAGCLDAARLLDDVAAGTELVPQLADAIELAAYPERGEIADLALFRAAEWLRQRGVSDAPDGLAFLRRGYDNLVRKMARLTPERRNGYLLQVSVNREILQAATQHGIAASA